MHAVTLLIFQETAEPTRLSSLRDLLDGLDIPMVENGTFTRFEFTDGVAMTCLVTSARDRPSTISLAAHLPGDQTGWDGWSREKETKRLEFQAAWLKERGIREMDTGPVRVSNRYDERSGGASIVVSYDVP